MLVLLSGGGSEAAGQPSAGAAPDAIQPGRWKVESTLEDGQRQTAYMCVLPEQAASGSFLRGEIAEGCTIERDEVAGGRIDLALRCASEGGGAMTSRMTGSYTATSYRTENAVDLGAGAPMKANVAGTYASATCQDDDFRLTAD
ncbi:DUF3617 domain-containing protein [Coralloluteibacterium stylophorae]|uniref:DUF3617 family protein n=1 Tax=Coralloluteibacterium stylophorae TaxID=1776034 RepID=A0A8J7VXN0_9GAMM|nr:DUF3617 family protein [Coralloluteibacterium stylophorae]MBS7456049.1 DUF3617 family protein [Coralloluteibacterium stylophorae]